MGVKFPIDVVALAMELIRFRSEDLDSHEIQGYLAGLLGQLGFTCTFLPFTNAKGRAVPNLVACRGAGSPHFAFAGHTDVVSVGDHSAQQRWVIPPFEPTVREGYLNGRGAEDMKGGLAAAISATALFVAARPVTPGTTSFLLTGDEEGDGDAGMPLVVDWLKKRGTRPDGCIIPEPASRGVLGATIKIGSRGCVDFFISLSDQPGHTAYPAETVNPVHQLLPVLQEIAAASFDDEGDLFEPTNVNVVTVDVGNRQYNSVPERVEAVVNVRYSDAHSEESLQRWVEELLGATGQPFTIRRAGFNRPYVTEPNQFTGMLQKVTSEVLGLIPDLITQGGASDARVLVEICPVVELGPVHATSHQVNERALIEDLGRLVQLYHRILERFFQV
ncbi:MAG: succinyl-diaminopimelate desuccinylase [Candidatus Kerfeldbacteria bacterium]|nr:succinyl-diaminopimelate desuccinylase [Candidatus Kerfeldbacteria bacterium]